MLSNTSALLQKEMNILLNKREMGGGGAGTEMIWITNIKWYEQTIARHVKKKLKCFFGQVKYDNEEV